ncbi:patatin-like phospholipase family protein [Methylovirgula sp. HY1]|uniref:patatin-like phospholipase family protein n=1 Tax=Methylovirgula sp. HY1 TaxID=2822761 RepID=UPI001C5B0102|nr:patatin-like phospholipase family protein [Methylovirgula sp. HY1]QXX73720.1 putative NTE family protein [Methylovirgula sp. HY1]
MFTRKFSDSSDKSTDATNGAAPRRKLKIGIALGAGAARGWSHIGVLQELAAHGIVPEIVAGTSIGAVVGGCYAADRLEALEGFVRGLTKRRVFGLIDLSLSGIGLLSGSKLRKSLQDELADRTIESLPKSFAVVATEVGTGHEVWLRQGHVVEAIRASYALPGIFEPVRINGRWLFDGALVNPVPVTVCRVLGADMVIAVNIIGDNAFRGTVISDSLSLAQTLEDLETPNACETGAEKSKAGNGPLRQNFGRHDGGAPGIAGAVMDAFNITQDRISRSRLAGDPPDVMINARNSHIGLFDFHRGDELIAIGREAARRGLDDIAEYIALTPYADADERPQPAM